MNQLLYSEILACPSCRELLFIKGKEICCTNALCHYSKSNFPFINDKPVLVDFENSIIQLEHLNTFDGSSLVKRNKNFSSFNKSIKKLLNGSNQITLGNFNKLDQLISGKLNPLILIVGGGTVGVGCEEFIKKYRHKTISFDVYNSSNVDFIADGHSIPFLDDSFDLVIIQAVLEHVLDPTSVVSECYRVIKPNGYIYAETPFLQHVHEGAYDFTRYTVLGHRILFKRFATISIGFVSGLGQSLLWSLDFFISGLFRTRKAGKIVKVIFFWIRWFEKLIPDEWNSDGACGCYFLGQKSLLKNEKKVSEFLAQYNGAQK